MRKLKPLREQVAVLVGASSGMGRATALRFAQRGAKLVVAARTRPALESLVQEITSAGGTAVAMECDVAEVAQVNALAAHAIQSFGRIDTWVQFSAATVYAKFEEITPEEFERIIRVNLLGQAYGAQAALPHLRAAGGGALILISSIESEISIPLTSAYAASKHGMNGFIDALRLELAHEHSPVSVTTVMPTGVNTPFFSNARTKLGVKPQPPPPIYSPEHVAEAVEYAAENRVRELFVGGAAKMMVLTNRMAPRLMDAYLLATSFTEQRTREPKSAAAPSSIFAPETGDSRIHGDFLAKSRKRSSYVWLQTHPVACIALKVAGVLAIASLVSGCCRDRD